jgi:Skp family chaperone for outer membrane proteins
MFVALFLVGRSWSDSKRSDPRPRSRIGLLNVSHVIRSYDKYTAFQKQLTEAVKPYSLKEAEAKRKAESLAKEAKRSGITPERRDAINQEIEALRRKRKALKAEFNEVIGKKQGEQLKALYADVEAATRTYARVHDLELVLQYNDGVTEAERNSPPNIVRKCQADACIPLYAAPGIEISKEIITALNDKLRRRKGR